MQDFSQECVPKKLFSYFSTKRYAVGTQKNRLNETVLLSAQNMLKLVGKKIITIYAQFFCFVYLNP